MSKERSRADRSNQAEVFDLVVYGICRGWLPAPHHAFYGSEDHRIDTESSDFSEPVLHRPRRHTFSSGALASAAIAILVIAIVASGLMKFPLMNNMETEAGFEPARFVAKVDDSLGPPP